MLNAQFRQVVVDLAASFGSNVSDEKELCTYTQARPKEQGWVLKENL